MILPRITTGFLVCLLATASACTSQADDTTTPPPRVLTVSGQPGGIARIRPRFDDPAGERGWSPLKATLTSALAKALFSMELARRLEGSGVTSNTFHPGLVRSKLASQLPWYLGIPASLASVFFSDESETGCFLALSAEVEGVTGGFFSGKKNVPSSFTVASFFRPVSL